MTSRISTNPFFDLVDLNDFQVQRHCLSNPRGTEKNLPSVPRKRRGGRWLGAMPSLWAHAFPGTVSGKYLLACWHVGMLACWHVGMFACWHVGMLALTLVDNFTCLMTILLVWQFYLFDNYSFWQLYMSELLSMCGNCQTIYRHVVYDKIGQKCSQQHEKTCHVCLGHGEVLKTPKHRCPHCQGHRVVPDNQFLTVKILPGEWTTST